MALHRTIRVLVVEDSPAYLYLIEKAFSQRGHEIRWDVTVAADGQEAVQILFAEEAGSAPLPDMILLDWNLPKISGSEVLRKVKQHEHLRKIPILVFSSSQADEDIHSAYGDYANGFITKPDDSNELATIVDTIEQFWIAVARIPKVLRQAGSN